MTPKDERRGLVEDVVPRRRRGDARQGLTSPPPEIVPFGDEHVAGAARLLAERHEAHRRFEPLLPAVQDFAAHVRAELADGSGSVALVGDDVVGYLIGKRREDPIGPHVWSSPAGHAVEEPELARDLYAAAAGRWVEEGLTRHFVFVPAIRELVEPWFRLSFGASAALALRTTAGVVPAASAVVVRQSTPDDLGEVARLAGVLDATLVETPSFSGFRRTTQAERETALSDLWEQDAYVHFVAELDGRVCGHVLLQHKPVDLRIPPRSVDLTIAATDPDVRGAGVGVAMTEHVLFWALAHGMTTMTTDWRMTNLAASRFWPRRGFREMFLRLYRSVP
jgi:GNAT superfamily N-acetyltransferase